MTRASGDSAPLAQADEQVSFLALGNVLLRRRRTIIALAVTGAVAGAAVGLLSPRVYRSAATFLPQVSEASSSGLALVASQFGIRLPTGGGGWGPAVYAELLRSRVLLGPLAVDTVVVQEQGGRRVALMDLLEVEAPTHEIRVDRTVRALEDRVKSRELRAIGAVEVAVTTKWASVSVALAERLVRGVNEFNVGTRRSQAAAERRFVEAQAGEAERALREAEDRLQRFLQRNRVIANSPELTFEHDRLERQVALRQQVYTLLLQNLEEARIREVRDTPVITIIETPRLPVVGEPRRAGLKGILGGIAGGIVGVVIAFVGQGVAVARREASGDAMEFFHLVEQATPRFLKRARR